MHGDAIAFRHLLAINDCQTRVAERDSRNVEQIEADLHDNGRRSGNGIRRSRDAAGRDQHRFASEFFAALRDQMTFVKEAGG